MRASSARPDPRGPASRRARACRVHFLRVERHDRFAGGLKPREKVIATRCPPRSRSYRSRRRWPAGGPRNIPLPAAARAPGPDVGRPTGEDCSQCSPTAAARGLGSTRAHAQGLWRIGRPPIRPVLKHGPGSLTCARVTESH